MEFVKDDLLMEYASTQNDATDKSAGVLSKTFSVEGQVSDSGKRISILSFDPSKISHGFVKEDENTESQQLLDSEETNGENRFLCSMCNTYFTSLLSLQSHMKYHDVQSEHTYSEDSAAYVDIDNPNNYTGPKPFQCNVCDRRFYTKGNLRAHMRTHSGDSPFSCIYCEKRFTYGRNLHRHIEAAHKGLSSNAALLCSRLYRAHNNSENRLVDYTGEGIKPYRCTVCSKTFRRLYRVKEHTRTHSGQKPFQCSVCSKLFSSSDILYRHIKRIHNGGFPLQAPMSITKSGLVKEEVVEEEEEVVEEEGEVVEEEEEVVEEEAGQTVVDISQLPISLQVQDESGQVNIINLARHSDIVEATLDQASTYYIDVRTELGDQLEEHVVQSEEQVTQEAESLTPTKSAFQCSLCGESFDSSSLLNKHLTLHKVETPTQCPVCLKEFKNDAYLRRHMIIHTLDKPYKCTLCPKAFYRQYRLNNHWRSHTGEKPYACSVCGKSFAVSDNMYRHIKKIHHGEGLQYATSLVKQIQETNRENKYIS